jgi:hypothetical protein
MEFTSLFKFENGSYRDMEAYKFTNEDQLAEFEKTLLNNDEGKFLENLITKMARNDVQCLRDDPLDVVSDSIKNDYVQIFKDYVHYDPESNKEGKAANLSDVKEDFNRSIAPENLYKQISIPTKSRYSGRKQEGTYIFEDILLGIGIMLPSIIQSNPNITFETLMPNFCNALQSETYCSKLLLKFTNLGGIESFYAPSEESLDTQLPINNEILDKVHALLISLINSTGIEPVDNNGELEFYTELDSTDPVNLCVRKRSKGNSEDMISKNSIPAIPLDIKGKIFEGYKTHRAQGRAVKSSMEYFGDGTGKIFRERMIYLQIEVTFKLAFVPQSNKRLLINPSKSYKIYDNNSVAITINTLKSMIENPGNMHIDFEKGIGSLVFFNDKFSRSRTDNDMKSAINEQLRKEFKKMDGWTFFKFLEDITGQDPNRKARLSDSNPFKNLNGFGISYTSLEFSAYVPDLASSYLDGLRGLKVIFGTLLKEAEDLEAFLTKKFEELAIDITSKVSLRNLIIKIIASEAKVDPINLASKGGYLGEIAKEFI